MLGIMEDFLQGIVYFFGLESEVTTRDLEQRLSVGGCDALTELIDDLACHTRPTSAVNVLPTPGGP